jgi:signal peptidase I
LSAAEQFPADRAEPPGGRRRAWLAALLSLIAPGTGQVYNGSGRLGGELFAAFIALDLMTIALLSHIASKSAFLAILLLAASELGLRLGAAIEAFRAARRVRPETWMVWQRGWVYLLLIVALPVFNFIAYPATYSARSFYAPSAAMVPTLLVGDYCIVDTRYYRSHAPGRGDVAVFHLSKDPSVDYIKRIVGLPGDRIQMRHGLLYVNDEPAGRRSAGDYEYEEFGRSQHFHLYVENLPRGSGESSYEHPIIKVGDDGPLDNTPVHEVPADHYFALGDNRDNSLDSRMLSTFGYVPAKNLIGHVEFLSFSAVGSARWWQIWRWPSAIRYGRVLSDVH